MIFGVVGAAAVAAWKRRDYLVMIAGKVDVEGSAAR
jgi:hypothetical protein